MPRTTSESLPSLINLPTPSRPVWMLSRLLGNGGGNGRRQAELPKPRQDHVCRCKRQDEGGELHHFKVWDSLSLGDPACPDIALLHAPTLSAMCNQDPRHGCGTAVWTSVGQFETSLLVMVSREMLCQKFIQKTGVEAPYSPTPPGIRPDPRTSCRTGPSRD